MANLTNKLPRKPLPLPLMLLGDVLLLAVCILTFSYFHHVRSESLVKDPDKLQQAVIPNQNPYGSTTALTTTTTGTSTLSEQTDSATQTETTTTSVTTQSYETTVTAGSTESHTDSTTTSTSTTTTTTTTTAVQYDLAGWGSKWPTLFALGDQITVTENSYRSHDVYINIETRQVGSSVAYIADVYVRYVDNLKSAFAKGEYGKNLTEWPQNIAAANNAILAVNGDYYGIRDNGVIVRNYTLYRDTMRNDVCSMFYDGTVTVESASEFNLDAAMQNGLYQTMSFGPALLRDYQAPETFHSHVRGINPRTGFGYYEPGHYVFITVDGRQDGYSVGLDMQDFAALFQDLGCKNAYNLDGGQSAMMIFQGGVYNQPYNGGRPTSDIFYIAEVN